MSTLKGPYKLTPEGELRFPRDRPVLVVFYPRDFSPVCTKQLCDYRDNIEHFRKLDCDVIATSSDSGSSHGDFARSLSLPFPILTDASGEVADAAGMKPTFGLLPKRGYAVFDRSGQVAWRLTDAVALLHKTTSELVELVRPVLKGL